MQHSRALIQAIAVFPSVVSLVAQGAVTAPSEVVVVPGQAFDPVPGTFVARVNHCCIDHDGTVAWYGSLRTGGPAGVTTADDQVLCLARTERDTVLVAREGGPEPSGRPGETLTAVGVDVLITPHGQQVAWLGNAHSAGTGYRDSLYLSSAQSTMALLTTGQAVPPPAIGTFSGFGTSDLSGTAFSATGRLVVHGLTDIGGNSPAIFAGLPGQLETVLYQGLAVTTLPSQPEIGHLDPTNLISADGSFPFLSRLRIGSGSPAVTADDDSILGIQSPGQPPMVIAREGDPAPGLGALVYSFFYRRSEQTGPNGEFTFLGYVRDAASQQVSGWGLYRASTQGGVPQLLLHSDLVLPDGSTMVAISGRAAVGPQGQVGAWCFCPLPFGTGNDDEAFLVGTPGSMSVLFREGDPVPSLPGARFGGALAGLGTSFDRHGNLVLRCMCTTSTGGTQWATLAYHPDRGFQNLMVQGQAIVTSVGTTTLVADESWSMRPTGGGGASMHAVDGDVARRWSMNVATATGSVTESGILRTHLGALSPSTASIPATGGHQFLTITAGAPRANHIYLLLGSLSGTEPGFSYGGVHIPLVNDFWVSVSQQSANSAVYLNSLGTLDSQGRGNVAFSLPWAATFLRGALFHHAALVFDPSNAALTWVSEPVSVHIH